MPPQTTQFKRLGESTAIYVEFASNQIGKDNSMSNESEVKPTILHIEDGDDWLRIVQRACEGAGFSVRRATTLAKAASLLTSHEFDAIVADIRLKDWQEDNIEGLEALVSLPKNKRPAAVVLSGFLDADNTRLAFKTFEVSDTIKKSNFDARTFVVMLKQAIKATRKMRYETSH